MFPLKKHIRYTHGWEYFSKLLFLQETSKKSWNILHVCSSNEIQKKYSIIAQDLSIKYYYLESYHDLSVLEEPWDTIYSICVDSLEQTLEYKESQKSLDLNVWDTVSMEELMKQLQDLHYEHSEYEKPRSYNRKGDILKIFYPHRWSLIINYWWDDIESLEENGNSISSKTLSSLNSLWEVWEHSRMLLDYIKEENIFCFLDMLEFHPLYEILTGEEYHSSSFDILWLQGEKRPSEDLLISSLYCNSLEDFKDILSQRNNRVQIFTRHSPMMQEFLGTNNFWHIKINSIKTHLLSSFIQKDIKQENIVYICDDVINKIFIKKRVRKKLSADVDLLLKIKNGDFVVHIDHGIWVFIWIIKKQLGKVEKEYMEISYKENDKLFVPITEVHRVSKYVGKENPALTPLSGKMWEKKMKKVHEDIREIAEGLLKNFAERKIRSSSKNILDTTKMWQFQDAFPYTYTEDQASAIEEIFTDMQSDKNMDRLIVGDVWFGKTEIAFNTAYLALLNRKQVLLISPLVVLAHEHYAKAVERFAGFWVRIEVLTRLQSQAHATRVIKWLADGTVDMVVGTHRLLSDKLVCKRLGVMIVDEEHKFWVVDKEKIKNIKSNIDILSLSATPIPRSLNLALSWVRDISLLKTPPTGRKSIETYVTRFNEKIIKEAWDKEFSRGGQIFFVHNRVSNIEVYKKQLQALFPKKKIVITHGQLPGDELEDRILDFKNKKYDILLSTTVIENGIDFSNVNTIFINECQWFGISQIHQLRWRVGRSDTQWYCYLLYRKEHLDGEAAKRIQTIVDYSYLWAGFELAMKDLEIRWGWDILWVKQSGQSQEIGVSLFLKMLEEKIEELKQEWSSENKKLKPKPTEIDLALTAGVPDNYFLSETDKLHFYREIELVEDFADLEYLKNSFLENTLSGDIPEETQNLFLVLECQILAKEHNIINIKKLGINYQVDFDESTTLDMLKIFLNLDTQVKFQVTSVTRLRSPVKGFENDKKFLEYLLRVFRWNVSWNKKIKLVKKSA